MPYVSGRFTPGERAFIHHMGETNDPHIAAMKAGYKQPAVAANKLMKRPEVAEASREAAARFLHEKAGAIGVMVATRIALDTTLPANTQLRAATELMKASGMYVNDGNAPMKEPHEMTATELREHASKLERQRDAMLKALSEQATVIEGETPQSGSAFD